MQTITVNKAKLLTTLQENRNAHRNLFLTAQVIFRDKVIQTLDRHLEEARAGGQIKLWIHLPEPEDHTASFDQAIAMVQWAEGDTIDLTEKDFQRYVLNNWEWQQSFAANTQSYVGS